MKKLLNLRESFKGTLSKGDSLLQAIVKTKSEAGLVQIRLLEIVRPDPEQSGDLKLLFQSITRENDKDAKPRHAYMPIGYAELEAFFGIKISERDKWFTNERGKEELTLNIINPTFVKSFNKGKILRVQVRESIYPKDEYQADHAEEQAKKNPSTNQKIYSDGQYVFANTFVVAGKPKHTWLSPDTDYKEKGTFSIETKVNKVNDFQDVGWTPPPGLVIAKKGTFDSLRESLELS